MAGVDIRTVAALLGHATIQMTMRYAHLAPEHNQVAVDALLSFSRAEGLKDKRTPNRTPAKKMTSAKKIKSESNSLK